MNIKSYLALATIIVLLSSCLKQSIADAMLNRSGQLSPTATLKYEINGAPVTVSVKNAANQPIGSRTLYCEKAGGYILSGGTGPEALIFTFYTDSLKPGNYEYISSYGRSYVTTFEGRAQYVYGPTDHMRFTVTSHKDGRISGTFSGQLTPVIRTGAINDEYGTFGSVVIRNGSFKDVPVYY